MAKDNLGQDKDNALVSDSADATEPHVPSVEAQQDLTAPYLSGHLAETTAAFDTTLDMAAEMPSIPGYQIEREIARGGMGRVLAAHDLTLDREVAIKLLLPTTTGDAAARFVTESKVTARLPHPGIPPVYALGETKQGGPFLAMKLVRGRTLADLLRLRERPQHDLARWIGVFEQVCQAVGFAHSQGILHRDLKPANIMVGAFGEVHVMDWGLAKDLSPSTQQIGDVPPTSPVANPLNQHPNATAAGRVMGTPQFMAPEQARGDAVDARTDVFALGGILSVILTGWPPFHGNSAMDIVRQAAAGDVDAALQRLRQCGADSELLQLAQLCLAAEAESRPADGQALAELIADYRVGVEERLQAAESERVATEARAAEQGKRRRLWAIAASVVITVLIAGGTAAGYQWLRAEFALEQVTDEQRRTQTALDDLMASRDRNLRNLRRVTKQLIPDLVGRKPVLTESDRAFIRGLLPMWQEVAAASGDEPEAIRLRAEANFAIANIQDNLGQFADAEQSYTRAVEAYKGLQLLNADPEARQSLARSHNNLGLAFASRGQLDDAIQEMESALALQQQLVEDTPEQPWYQRELARSHMNLGTQLGNRGDDTEAQQHYDDALKLLAPLIQAHPEEPAFREDLAGMRVNLANLHHRRGMVQKTLEQYSLAVKLYQKLVQEQPDVSNHRRKLAAIRMNLGSVLLAAGGIPQAEAEYRAALGVRERLAAEYPGVTEYRANLATTLSNLGVLLAGNAKRDEAEQLYNRALSILDELLKQSPGTPEYRSLLASTYDNLGLLHREEGASKERLAQGEGQHRAALKLWIPLLEEFPDNPEFQSDMADTHNHLGLLLSDLGRHEESEAEFQRAFEVWDEMIVKFPERIDYQMSLAGACCNFANLVVQRGELEDARGWFDKAIGLLEPRVQSERKDVKARRFLRNSYWGRAEVGDQLGETDSAAEFWERALAFCAPQEKLILRSRRADSRARAGLAKEAVDELDAIAPLLPWPPGNRYNFACIYSVASDKAEQSQQSQQYADKAMNMLQQAIQGGWNDAARLRSDPDLKPLHDRDDFQTLLDDLN